MSLFTKLLGRRQTNATAPRPAKKAYREADNLGTRHDTVSKATAYWMGPRLMSVKKDPFVMYTFDHEPDARAALLELSCIHEAQDTGQLICTETLIFGYYWASDRYEAVICGDELTHNQWRQAKASFARHGGKRKNDLEPAPTAAPARPRAKRSASDTAVVRFVRNESRVMNGCTMTYAIHRASSAAAAKAFLQRNPVHRRLHYVVVETLEGNYGRDIDGIYKE